jgi:glycosyltransferase involved in cell wall biosynthesis
MDSPLVSVICLCHNHVRFVEEAILSVISQSYENMEIVVVDDCSTDGSKGVITGLVLRFPRLKFISLDENIGNCAAFNRGLAVSSGAYLVDFSADDVFRSDRIKKQVAYFQTLDESYGVVFTDVQYIDEDGKHLYRHFDSLRKKKLIREIPSGDIYSDILRSYFVSSPSMLVKREVFDHLQGYDEKLAYEDFDFWVRSSREFKYGFMPEVLTLVRKSRNSLSTKAYSPGDRQLHSTYLVCRKAQELTRTEQDKSALIYRVRYELRHAVLSENYAEAELFIALLKELTPLSSWDNLLWSLLKMRVPLARLRRLYHGLRYQ